MGVGATIKNILTSDSDKTSTTSRDSTGVNRDNSISSPTALGSNSQANHGRDTGIISNNVVGTENTHSHGTSGPNATHHHDTTTGATGAGAATGREHVTGSGTRDVPGTNHPEHSHTTGTGAGAAGVAGAAANELHGRENVTGSRTGDFSNPHSHGHHKLDSEDIMPKSGAREDSTQLNPLTHERVRHVETEEVERHKEHHRNVHHVQHHTVPVAHREEREEQHHEKIHPVTKVHEKHASKDEDVQLLHNQVRQHQGKVEHSPVERHIVDKGTVVDERVHHHVHHVVQPIS